MTEEEIDRLNFYSKYSRAPNKNGIQSLYSLISGAKSASNLQIQIVSQSRVKQRSLRKASASPKKLRKPASAKPIYTEPSQPVENGYILTEQLTSKLDQLRKLQDQFHQQMAQRERQARRRKQQLLQLKRSKQKQDPISVIDEKQVSSPRKSSSELRLKRSVAQDHAIKRVTEQDLDFQDYYMDGPEVPISQNYDHTNDKQKLKDMLQIQRMREQEVQSVDEDCEKANSIVIGRLDINNRVLQEHNISEDVNGQSGLTHTNSQKYFTSHKNEADITPERPRQSLQVENNLEDIDSSQCQPLEMGKELSRWQLSKNGPPKQVQSMQNIPDYHPELQNIDSSSKNPSGSVNPCQSGLIEEHDPNHLQIPLHHSGNVPARAITNRTATDEGSEFRDQIADQVDPIQKKSDMLHKNDSQSRPIYHSQTINQPIDIGRQVQSIPTSPNYSQIQSFNQITNRQKQLEQRKSSFKRLMAQNRANLVPRMAISTILNEHINQALVDFKVPPPVSSSPAPQLKQSMVQSQLSPSSSKKKVNFKRRIVEKQKDKSYSRQSKPNFERDPAKVQRNKKLLADFFQDN